MGVVEDGFGGFSVGPSLPEEDVVPPVTHFTLVTGEDDWQGLYVNGELRDENHRLASKDVFDMLFDAADGLPCAFHQLTVRDSWLMDEGRLPASLGAIPQEARV